jgi:transposase
VSFELEEVIAKLPLDSWVSRLHSTTGGKPMQRYIGMDVHKREVAICFVDRNGKVLKRCRCACTRETLEKLARTQFTAQDQVALETTTNAWAVADLIRPHVARVLVSNPVKTRIIAEAKVKTDKVDAEVLAQLLRCNYLPEVWAPDGQTRLVRRLSSRRAGLVADRIATKNRIHSLLGGLLIQAPLQDIFGPRGRSWLETVELPPDQRAVLNLDLRMLDAVNRETELLDDQLKMLAYRDDRMRLLVTLPGIDYAVAAVLMGALGDITRFRDGDHVASYLGLVPSTRQSGDHCYHGPITKCGRGQARWMLVQAAQHLAQTQGPLGAFYRRLARRKGHAIAVVAAARKMVTIVFLMLKNNEPYRYAVPLSTREKLARLRIAATGERRHAKPSLGKKGRPASYGSKVHQVRSPGLAEVYATEGLPPMTAIDALPSGERQMLDRESLLETVTKMQQPRHRVRKNGHLLPEC